MRQLQTIINQKPKNSRFFDHFIKQHGDVATKYAGEDEIQKNLKALYLDIAFGNLQQEKYLQYLLADDRIVQLALMDLYNHLMDAYNIYEALLFARNAMAQCTQNDFFMGTLKNAESRYFTYSILYQAFTQFQATAQMQFLTSVAVTFNNPINRGSKSVLL